MVTKARKAVAPRKRAQIPAGEMVASFPDAPDPDRAKAMAKMVTRASINAASVVHEYAKGPFGELGLAELAGVLSSSMTEVCEGDMTKPEAMLFGQAMALQAIFVNMARRAPKQELIAHWDSYMRVALKAQNQCRMTLETLAAIKNPPVVIARQANINNGGQQQVNNGQSPANESPTRARAFAADAGHARETDSVPNELMGTRPVRVENLPTRGRAKTPTVR